MAVEDKSQNYKAEYVRVSKVKELFKRMEGDNEISIRISKEAKSKVMEFIDTKIKEGVEELIDKLPVKSKGDKKGQLSRITIKLNDFEED